MEGIFGSFWLAILQILPQDLATHTNIWENGSPGLNLYLTWKKKSFHFDCGIHESEWEL